YGRALASLARSCAQTPEPTRGFLGEGGEESLTARFDSGESQLHCRPRAGPLLPGEQSQTQRVTRRLAKKPGALNVASLEPCRPGGGRDPGKKRRAMRAGARTPAYARATKVGIQFSPDSSARRPGSRQRHGPPCANIPALRRGVDVYRSASAATSAPRAVAVSGSLARRTSETWNGSGRRRSAFSKRSRN